MYFFVEHQNGFWHVPQTCPDRTNTTVCLVSFFGVDLLLGTCACIRNNSISGIKSFMISSNLVLVFCFHLLDLRAFNTTKVPSSPALELENNALFLPAGRATAGQCSMTNLNFFPKLLTYEA